MLHLEEIELFSRHLAAKVRTDGGKVAIPAPTGSSGAFLALALAMHGGADGNGRAVLAVTPGLPAADALAADLETLAGGDAAVHEYPPDIQGDGSAAGCRALAAAALASCRASPQPCIVVAPFAALAVPAAASSGMLRAENGKTTFQGMAQALDSMGYRRSTLVENEGEWAARGSLIDAWSPGAGAPVRMDFFGETLESVRWFNPGTQRSTGEARGVEFIPATAPEDGGGVTLSEMLPDGWALVAIDHDAYAKSALPRGAALEVFAGDPPPPGVERADFLASPLPGFGELDPAKLHHPELFEEARARLAAHLEAAKARGERVFAVDALSAGFELPPDGGGFPGMAVVAKSDRLFTKRAARRARHEQRRGARLSSFDELEPGELVVHVDHGIGRFAGSTTIVTAGVAEDVYIVEYAGGAKLYVPADHANLLTRYVGVKGREAKLGSLGGTRWTHEKAKAEKAVADLAASLLETQAKREAMPGFAFDIDCEGKEAFYAAFPYEETADQLAAVKAVEADMASTKPMDRLLCGDAGYGKTEVAMRAAYIAAMNGKQTAVIAPTTVLAEQHFETFLSRFAGTPVRVEPVSRFQTQGEIARTFKRLASGGCDIVVGTHALLSADMSFRDLGLIVIDEEQRFGVRHKEFLKKLRTGADILTLSATPIPRTLYMSMTGAKDLSLLQTPPRLRTAVETIVERYSDRVVREAIEAELARGGLVFCLHNRINSMPAVEKRLKALVPQAKITVAHGRMDPDVLAAKMKNFESGRSDVLLSTTIVESGIDIPRANTIIVFDAQMFGLADLYQLRGRVGRSSVQGRAIFLLPERGEVESDARERLAALKRHGAAGAGFSIAMRDLELRGAGNLLGAKQSGHIVAVGFSLYCQLLRRSVARLKGENLPDAADVRLGLDFISLSSDGTGGAANASLPHEYIGDGALRMSFVRRIAESMKTDDIDAVREELADRFGPLPDQARRLLSLGALRLACAAAGVGSIDSRGGKAFIRRTNSDILEMEYEFKSDNPDRRIAELMVALREIRRAKAHPR